MNPFKKPATKWEQKRRLRYGKGYIVDTSMSKKAAQRRAKDREKEKAWLDSINVVREPMVAKYLRLRQEETGGWAWMGMAGSRGVYLPCDVISFARNMRKEARRYLSHLTAESIQLNWDTRCLARQTMKATAPARAVRL